MASVITYNQVIELLTDICRRHYQLNTFYLGRNWELENDDDILFPLFQVYPDFGRLPVNAYNEYKTQEIRFVCKVVDTTVPSEDNERDVHSDTLRIAQDIVNEFNQHPFYVRSSIKLIGDITFVPLEEFEDDISAGWQFNLTFQILNLNTFCGMPIEEIPGYSATGPTSQGELVDVRYLTCATLPDCPVISDLIAEDIDLDIRVTALEQGSGGGNFIPLSGTNGTDLVTGSIDADQDLSSFYQPYSFIQKDFADNNYVPISISTLGGITSTISNVGPRILSTVNDTVVGNTSVIDQRSNRYTLSSNLSNGFSSGMALINGSVRLSATDANNNYTNDLKVDTISFDVLGTDNNNNTYYQINGQNTGSIYFETKGLNGTVTISINDNDALVGSADYTAFYSAFSFVQKIYVDNAITSIPTSSLSQVLNAGNSTGTNDIVVNAGQLIKSSLNLNNIALNVSGTPDIRIQSARDININAEYINITPSNGGVLNLNGTGVAQRFAISTSLNMDSQLAFSTNSGIYRHFMYVKDHDQTMNFYTVNSDTIFYNGPGSNQYQTIKLTFDNHVIINDLIGTGIRMVVADSAGLLSTQAIVGLTSFSATGPLQYNNGTGVFSITQATTSQNGYLSNTDWNTFNNKQAALGFTPENSANKATTFGTLNNTLYPTTQAVSNFVTGQGYITSSALTPYLLSSTAVTTYQPLDADLTAIAALSGKSGFLKTNGAGTWSVDTNTYVRGYYKDLTSSTAVTDVTTNTLVKSVLIPANTFAVGDRIVIKTMSTKTGTAGTNSVRCYVNTTAAIGGVSVSLTRGAAANLSLPTERSLIVINATNNTQAFPAGTSATYDNIGSVALSTLVIDWTVAQYIVFASQNSAASDSSSMVYVEIQKA